MIRNALFVLILTLLLCLPPAVGDEDLINELLADPPATGLLVTRVVESSQAAVAGILAGDIVVSYGGKPTPDIPAMNLATREVGEDEQVALVVVRRSGRFTFSLKPGRIGVNLIEVVKGKGREPLPADTGISFDCSSLKEAPQDNWYALYREGKKCGVGRITSKVVGGMLFVITREVIDLDTGLVDNDVTSVVSSHCGPLPLMTTFRDHMNDWVRFGLFGTNDHREPVWNVTTHGPGIEAESIVRRLAPDAVPGYAMETLASLMPKKAGACFRFRPLQEASGEIGLGGALFCVGEELIALGDSNKKAHRYEWRRLEGGISSTFWIGEDNRMILADYGGLRAVLSTEAEAQKDQPESVTARLAR